MQRFGAFVKLDESGADGLIPVRTMGREFFHFDAASQTLMGSETGLTIGIGQRVTVRLVEAVPVTGGLMLELLEVAGAALPRGPRAAIGAGRGRKVGPSKARADKVKRKVVRKRRG